MGFNPKRLKNKVFCGQILLGCKKYLVVLFWKCAAYKPNNTLKPLLSQNMVCFRSQCPWNSFNSSTELKRSSPLARSRERGWEMLNCLDLTAGNWDWLRLVIEIGTSKKLDSRLWSMALMGLVVTICLYTWGLEEWKIKDKHFNYLDPFFVMTVHWKYLILYPVYFLKLVFFFFHLLFSNPPLFFLFVYLIFFKLFFLIYIYFFF